MFCIQKVLTFIGKIYPPLAKLKYQDESETEEQQGNASLDSVNDYSLTSEEFLPNFMNLRFYCCPFCDNIRARPRD